MTAFEIHAWSTFLEILTGFNATFLYNIPQPTVSLLIKSWVLRNKKATYNLLCKSNYTHCYGIINST